MLRVPAEGDGQTPPPRPRHGGFPRRVTGTPLESQESSVCWFPAIGSRSGSLWKEAACQGCTEACLAPTPPAPGSGWESTGSRETAPIGPLKGAPELPRVSALVKCGLSSSGRRNRAELGFFVPGAASRSSLPPPPPAPQHPPPRALLPAGWPGLSWVSGQQPGWPLTPCGTALRHFPSWLESSRLAAPCLGAGHLPMLTPGTPVATGESAPSWDRPVHGCSPEMLIQSRKRSRHPCLGLLGMGLVFGLVPW